MNADRSEGPAPLLARRAKHPKYGRLAYGEDVLSAGLQAA